MNTNTVIDLIANSDINSKNITDKIVGNRLLLRLLNLAPGHTFQWVVKLNLTDLDSLSKLADVFTLSPTENQKLLTFQLPKTIFEIGKSYYFVLEDVTTGDENIQVKFKVTQDGILSSSATQILNFINLSSFTKSGTNVTTNNKLLDETFTLDTNNKIKESLLPDTIATDADLSGKVDKITGKGLSTEDYTTEDKAKVTGIQTALDAKANDNNVVKLSGNQTASGTKTFTGNLNLVPTGSQALSITPAFGGFGAYILSYANTYGILSYAQANLSNAFYTEVAPYVTTHAIGFRHELRASAKGALPDIPLGFDLNQYGTGTLLRIWAHPDSEDPRTEGNFSLSCADDIIINILNQGSKTNHVLKFANEAPNSANRVYVVDSNGAGASNNLILAEVGTGNTSIPVKVIQRGTGNALVVNNGAADTLSIAKTGALTASTLKLTGGTPFLEIDSSSNANWIILKRNGTTQGYLGYSQTGGDLFVGGQANSIALRAETALDIGINSNPVLKINATSVTFSIPVTAPNGTASTHLVTKGQLDSAIGGIDSNNVKLTGDQTVGGIKNFTSNIGVGTTTPNRNITVESTASSSVGIRLNNTATGGRSYSFFSTNNTSGLGGGKFGIFDDTSSSSRLTIDPNGNVGINNNTPLYKLDVDGTGNFTGTVIGATATASTHLIQKGQVDTLLSTKADLVGGLVPSSQLPSFVDDVLEFANLAAFPVTGETGKIYIALDTNVTYRWSGSAYVEISASLALGESSSTAYRGDRGKTAYDHSQLVSGNPHNVTKTDVGLSNVDNTSDLNKPVSNATATALATKEPTITGGTTSQYFRGDKTFQDFFTDVRATTLTGLSTVTNAVITATDTVLSSLGKIQAQLNNKVNLLTLDSDTTTIISRLGYTPTEEQKKYLDYRVKAIKDITSGTLPAFWADSKISFNYDTPTATTGINLGTHGATTATFNLNQGTVRSMGGQNGFTFDQTLGSSGNRNGFITSYTLNPRNNVTFFAVIRTNSVSSPVYKNIFGASVSSSLEFRLKNAGMQFTKSGASEIPATPANVLIANLDQCIAGTMASTGSWLTYTGNTLITAIDAGSVGADLANYVDTILRVGIGTDDVPMRGIMQAPMVFTSVLTASQLQQIYNLYN